jgi:hypothetical protein
MTDEIMTQGKPKKPGLLRRIGWWLWVIFLTSLLVLGFVFAAPWKVITLIVIFLAAVTILPRIYRKWFWAGVCLAFIIFIVWVLTPTDHDGWEMYKYDFSSQLAKLEQERAISPADNAAPDYLALLKEDDGNDANLTDHFLKVYNSPWKSLEHPDAAKSIEKHSQTIKILIDISKIPGCRFPLDKPYDELNPVRYKAFFRWNDMLTASCNKDIGEGRHEQALEKAAAIAQLGRHQIQQGVRMDMMSGIGTKSRAYDIVRTLIMNGLNEEELAFVQNTICAPDNDWGSAWLRMLEYDKLTSACAIAAYYEINHNGQIRISRDPLWPERMRLRKLLGEYNADTNESSTSLQKLFRPFIYKTAYPSWSETKLLKAGTLIRWLFLPESPEDAFAFNEKRGIYSRARKQDHMHMSVLERYKHSMVDSKGTLLLIALKHYKGAFGTWPQNLDENKPIAPAEAFIDPLNNGEFVYKLTDEGFTLYSKGKNGIDNGRDGDDRMIWPIPENNCP